MVAPQTTGHWHSVVVVKTPVAVDPAVGRGVLMDLALDPALHADSQAEANEEVLHRTGDGLLGLGDTVTFRARHFGIPWTMTARVTELDRPHLFVDEQVSGPFAAFRHTHRFTSDEAATVMIDEFAFRLPAGPVGGLVARTTAAPYLRRLLTHRARFLARRAEELSRSDEL